MGGRRWTSLIFPKRNLEWLHEMNLRFLRLSQGSRPEYRAATEELGTEVARA